MALFTKNSTLVVEPSLSEAWACIETQNQAAKHPDVVARLTQMHQAWAAALK